MRLMNQVWVVVGIVVLSMSAAATANANSITFTGSNGSGLSASATFDVQGSNLVVTLSSTGGDPAVPADVLTGLFFDITGTPSLTATSAIVGAGSSVVHGGTTDPGNSVGGEWAYKSAVNLAYGGDYGIGAAGFGLFGPANLFGGSNLAGPVSPGDDDYGIISIADTAGNDNPALNSLPLIKNSVVFTLSGLPQGFDPSSISNVTFQFGSALENAHFPGSDPPAVPEPATLLLLGSGLSLVARQARRSSR